MNVTSCNSTPCKGLFNSRKTRSDIYGFPSSSENNGETSNIGQHVEGGSDHVHENGQCGSAGKRILNASEPEEVRTSRGKAKRPVRFGVVRIREYGLTVGAYAASNDTCPLQLTWEHSPREKCLAVDDHQATASVSCSVDAVSRSRSTLKPLTVDARRTRIAQVQGTTSSVVARLEYALAMAMIEETMQIIDAMQR